MACTMNNWGLGASPVGMLMTECQKLFEMPNAQDGEFQRSAEKVMTKDERGRMYAR